MSRTRFMIDGANSFRNYKQMSNIMDIISSIHDGGENIHILSFSNNPAGLMAKKYALDKGIKYTNLVDGFARFDRMIIFSNGEDVSYEVELAKTIDIVPYVL